MIPSADLARIIARHTKLVGDVSSLHLRASGDKLLVASSNKTGVILRTRAKYEGGDITACVDGAILAGIIRGQGPLDLTVKDARLHLKGGRLRADIPIVSGEIPRIPKAEDARVLPAKEVEHLREALSRMAIKEGGPDSLLSLACDGREWQVCYFDNYYGAFHAAPGKTKIELGFLPQDVPLLEGALAASGEIKLAQVGMQLLISTAEENFLIPSTTPNVVSVETVDDGAKLCAKFDVAALKLTLDSMSALTKDKDASTINLTIKDGITLSVTSSAGSMRKKIDAQVKTPTQLAINYKFLRDMASLCGAEEASLYTYVGEDKSVTRIQVRCAGIHYVAVTSV